MRNSRFARRKVRRDSRQIDNTTVLHRDGPWDCALFYAKATVHASAGTLRKVTNGVIENQYLRLIFTLLPLSTDRPPIRLATLETSNERVEPFHLRIYLFLCACAPACARICMFVRTRARGNFAFRETETFAGTFLRTSSAYSLKLFKFSDNANL